LAIRALLVIFLVAAFAFGEGTRSWEQSKFEDLEKGTTDGVAIRSDGGLELAPAFKAVVTTPSAYLWSIAADRSGNLYAAAGSPARVYKITPDGKSSAIFQSQELQVQALAIDNSGAIYAATNPDGKIYRLEPDESAVTQQKKENGKKSVEGGSSWSSSVYFDPGSKYIWDLAFDKSGNLYVATGDHGEIFKVTPRGDHSVFFKSDEAQIRVLAFDLQGNLIAGSDGSGLIYRISPSGEGFVLYSAPKKEITALALDASGNIYAAGVGEKRNSPAVLPGLSIPSSISSPTSAGPTISLSGSASSPLASAVPGGISNAGSSASGGSDVYRIAIDGAPTRVWASREDLVYALAFDANGELLAGTGNGGRVFRIRGEDQFTDLLKVSASQVTAFARAAGTGLYASTSNLGKIFLVGGVPEGEGTYQSDVFDAHIFSRWGRAEFRGRGSAELFARSGNVDNPDRNWSPWKKIEWQKDAEVAVPPARFIQWKAVLRAGNPPPRVDSVTVNYLSKNVAPDIDEVTVQEGVRYQPGIKSSGDGGGNAQGASQRVDSPPAPIHDRASIGVRWSVHDDNEDDMVYSIYYRGEGESRWLLLKDNLADKFYSFDSSLLPDGAYIIKVIASDAPSHSPGQALTAEKDSARFEMDTTPPQIEDLRGTIDNNQAHVTFRAVDNFSPIQKAEYSVDAGDWQLVEPVGQISDSKTENYDFLAGVRRDASEMTDHPKTAPGDHVVVVRVYDRHDNMGSAKTVIREK
jgi:hypothetical protein